jgi:hypothetical protein
MPRSIAFKKIVSIVILTLAITGASASETLLNIPTRFGAVSITKDESGECCTGSVRFRSDRVELNSTGELYANLENVFQTADGDVIVLSVASGVRGSPDNYYVLLVSDSRMVDVTPKDFYVTDDGNFKAVQKGDEILFDLGFENRKHKTAFYRAGVIYVGTNNTKIVTSLPKQDCANVLNEVADCARISDCANFEEFIPMSTQRGFPALENKSVFTSENFSRLCKSICVDKNYNAASARKILCGY